MEPLQVFLGPHELDNDHSTGIVPWTGMLELLTKLTGINFNPSSPSPRWKSLLYWCKSNAPSINSMTCTRKCRYGHQCGIRDRSVPRNITLKIAHALQIERQCLHDPFFGVGLAHIDNLTQNFQELSSSPDESLGRLWILPAVQTTGPTWNQILTCGARILPPAMRSPTSSQPPAISLIVFPSNLKRTLEARFRSLQYADRCLNLGIAKVERGREILNAIRWRASGVDLPFIHIECDLHFVAIFDTITPD